MTPSPEHTHAETILIIDNDLRFRTCFDVFEAAKEGFRPQLENGEVMAFTRAGHLWASSRITKSLKIRGIRMYSSRLRFPHYRIGFVYSGKVIGELDCFV